MNREANPNVMPKLMIIINQVHRLVKLFSGIEFTVIKKSDFPPGSLLVVFVVSNILLSIYGSHQIGFRRLFQDFLDINLGLRKYSSYLNETNI